MTKMLIARSVVEQALEALEFLSLEFFMLDPISPGRESTIKAITALRAALVEPQPVAQPEQDRNFCQRCGKRTNDIHTCTPPMENT
jgi:hypothetical protein